MVFQIKCQPSVFCFIVGFCLFPLLGFFSLKKKDGENKLSDHMKEPFARHIKTLCFHWVK